MIESATIANLKGQLSKFSGIISKRRRPKKYSSRDMTRFLCPKTTLVYVLNSDKHLVFTTLSKVKGKQSRLF